MYKIIHGSYVEVESQLNELKNIYDLVAIQPKGSGELVACLELKPTLYIQPKVEVEPAKEQGFISKVFGSK